MSSLKCGVTQLQGVGVGVCLPQVTNKVMEVLFQHSS